MDESCELNNGSISLSRTGGSAPFTYLWSHDASVTTAAATDLSSGIYSVIITDNVGCADTIMTTLDSIPSPQIDLVSSSNNSCDQANGMIVAEVLSGTGPYTYAWSHDASLNDSIAVDLVGGFYEVILTDNGLCMDTLIVNIVDEPILQLSEITVTESSCSSPTGTAVVGVGGGAYPYVYSWSHDPTETDSIAMMLAAGTYQVVVTDMAGCLDTINIEVFEAIPPSISINTIQNATCGQSNGSIILDVSGGDAPFTYTWSHDVGLNDSIAVNLVTDVYFVTVTDVNNCTDTLSIFVPCDLALSVTVIDSMNETCESSNGSITIGVSGGFTPYTYLWSHNVLLDTSFVDGLSAGNYTVTVTDNNSTAQVRSVTLSNAQSPMLSIGNIQQNNCTIGNGSISLNITSGLPPFDYNWSHSSALNDSIANDLSAGLYSVTLTDAVGCVDTISQLVIDEDLLAINILEVINTGCGIAIGEIHVEGDLGRPPYSYAWSHDVGLTDSIATNLGNGDYTVTVTDDSGWEVVETITITTTGGPIISLVDSMNSTCNLANGSATISVSGGTPGYTYAWSHNVNELDSVAMNLAAGDYMVTVTDANNCTNILSFNLTGTPALIISMIDTVHATCGFDNGMISASTTGGSAPLTYQWSHDVSNNTPTASNLPAGNYRLIVTDIVGCADTFNQTISNSPDVTLSLISIQSNSCNQANGQIVVSTTGGTAPIDYSWSHDASITDSVADGLTGGIYTIIATDALGCSDTLLQTITNEPTLAVSEVSVTPTSCIAETGEIIAAVSGGQGPYNYSWDHDASLLDSIASGLGAGAYQLIVSDAIGCSDTIVFNVEQAPVPELSVALIQNENCGLSDGSIIVSVTGGTAPFSYSWSHDVTLNDSVATNLSTDTYAITVTDANGCSDVLSVFLPCDVLLSIEVVDSMNELCNLSNGSIMVSSNGGVTPYTYSWSHDASITGNVAANLGAGVYVIIVSDSINNMDTISVTLENIAGLTVAVTSFSDNTCAQANGSITVGMSNGVGPYVFSWSHDATLNDSTAINLSAGNYSVIVTDANGCMDTANQIIIDGDLLALNLIQVDSSACSPGTGSIEVEATGGVGVYTFSWSHDATLNAAIATNLETGTYTVSVVDDSGCQVEMTIDLPEFTGPIIANVFVQNTNCGSPTGFIELGITGGLSPYNYEWSHDPLLNDPLATGLSSGFYSYTITDARNCEVTGMSEVESSTDLDISLIDLLRPSCDMDNGRIQIELSGGVAPYAIEWFNVDDLNTVIGTDLVLGKFIRRNIHN